MRFKHLDTNTIKFKNIAERICADSIQIHKYTKKNITFKSLSIKLACQDKKN